MYLPYMKDLRIKAKISNVEIDIKPFIIKKWFMRECVNQKDLQTICDILLAKYNNVSLFEDETGKNPELLIRIKGLFKTKELRYEILGGLKKKKHRNEPDLSWIDRLEELDAILND